MPAFGTFSCRNFFRDPRQQRVCWFVARMLRYKFATHSELKDCLAQ